jgi:hypothetical protein
MKKVLCMILTLMFTLSAAGCAAGANSSEAKPEEAVKGYFEAAKLMDTAAMNKFVNPKNAVDTTSSASNEYEKMFMDYLKGNTKKVTYSFEGSEVTGETATVTVNCKYVDGTMLFSETLAEFYTKALDDALNGKELTDEETGKEIIKIMKEKQKTVEETFAEKTIKVKCVKIDNKWYIDEPGKDIENVFTSNLLTVGEEMDKPIDGASSDAESTDETAAPAAEDAAD